jgi:Glycosyltransferase family 87
MSKPATNPNFPEESRARRLRLSLALLAVALSFASVLRTHMVTMSDLYSRWYGTRELLLHGRSPYSEAVNQEIQIAFYGHVLTANEPRDQQRFAYPAYAVLLFWPMAFMSYATVWAIAIPLLIAAGAGVVLCCIGFVQWPLAWEDRASAVLIGLSTAPMLRAFRFEQLSTLVVLFLVGTLLALSKGRPIIAGVLLACATIKPQMALLPVLWLLIWALSNWKERKNFVIAFLAQIGIQLLVSSILVPGWFLIFPGELLAYSHYAGHDSLLTTLAGTPIGWLLTVIVLACCARITLPYRRAAATTRAFQFSTSLVLAFSSIAMPTMAAQHNLVMAFPAAFIVLRDFRWLPPALRGLIVCLLAWTPATGIATLAYDVEVVRVVQMSAGLFIAGAVVISMMRFSERLVSADCVSQSDASNKRSYACSG